MGLAKINILYIEDNPDDVAILEEMLDDQKLMACSLIHADHLAAGLEKLDKGGVDILLLDLSLPDSHGFTTFQTVKKQAKDLPIIVMTGLNDETLAVKAVQEGAQDYLVKGQADANLLMRASRYAIERVARDVAERKRIEAERCLINAQLEEKVAQRTRDLAETVEQLRSLAMELSELENQERRQLAETLHGDLQQLLAAGFMQAERLLSRNEPLAQQTRGLEFVVDVLQKAQQTARSLSHDLSPPILHHGSMNDILQWLADRERELYSLEVIFTPAADLTIKSNPLRTIVYRVAQELLYNVVKHARADTAWLALEVKGGGLWLTVLDHGCGFDPALVQRRSDAPGTTIGFGLLTITERIKALGGDVEIDSRPGFGSRYTIFLPLPPA